MRLVGVLPVAGINIGLTLYPPIILAKIDALLRLLLKLNLSLGLQVDLNLSLPTITLPGLIGALEGALIGIPEAIAEAIASLPPTKWISANVDVNVDAALELGLVAVALEAALAVDATFQAGLSASGLHAWSFSGSAHSMADSARVIRGGKGTTNAIMIATESLDSWGALSQGVYTGNPTPGTWTDEGSLSMGELNTGVLAASFDLGKWLLKLKGLKASLTAQVGLSLGLNLPNIPLPGILARLEAALRMPDILFHNILNVNLDILAKIKGIELQIEILLDLILDLNLALSAGGLALWSFTGNGSDLPASVAGAVAGGVPGGRGPDSTVHGLVVTCAVPEVWASFGTLLAV